MANGANYGPKKQLNWRYLRTQTATVIGPTYVWNWKLAPKKKRWEYGSNLCKMDIKKNL
jgi:hypothetical protein